MGEMIRYWTHDEGKPKRDVVLLQGYPCMGKGRCVYCDYHEDNGYDNTTMSRVNENALMRAWLEAKYDCLQITNSGSYYDLPLATHECIIQACTQYPKFTTIILEARWEFHTALRRTKQLYKKLGVDVLFYLGVESWDPGIRKALGKDWHITPEMVKCAGFNGVNILVGHRLQTAEDARKDIEITSNEFKYAMINVYKNRTGKLEENSSFVNDVLACVPDHFEINCDPEDWNIGGK